MSFILIIVIGCSVYLTMDEPVELPLAQEEGTSIFSERREGQDRTGATLSFRALPKAGFEAESRDK